MSLLDGLRVADLTGTPGRLAGRALSSLGAEVSATLDAGSEIVLTDWTTPPDVVAAVPGDAVHVRLTPYGSDGPRAGWLGSDLTVLAASGNLHATGDPDRPPVRCLEPVSYAHAGGEMAVAVLVALAADVPQTADVSAQETVQAANMTAAARYPMTGDRGQRRGAYIGRTRETWRCADGWVVFGMRGGRARARNWEVLTELLAADGIDVSAFEDRDWASFDHRAASDEELDALSEALAAWFARLTMAELYDIATSRGIMLAPVADAERVLADPQLRAREFFRRDGDVLVPGRFVRIVPEREPEASEGTHGAVAGAGETWLTGTGTPGRRALAGLRVLELGSGAAGPMITRYLVEHGATCVRIESERHPDFLRTYATRPDLPRLEGSAFFAVLNHGKRSVALDLKDPEGLRVARRLVGWADAVVENFAPGALERLGLDYDTLAVDHPGLVMLSSSMYGQTGPHRRYPGFGSQGAALSGYTHLTGWPDRAPVGPYGTITDSLAPRYGAAALLAALLHRRRTGRGAHLDVSQIEVAVWTLSDWLVHEQRGATPRTERWDPDDPVSHGVFRSADGWVATDPRTGASYPVNDFGDLHDDPQLAARGHFVPLEHPVLGRHLYERSGFRLSATPGGIDAPGPTLGQHTDEVLGELLTTAT